MKYIVLDLEATCEENNRDFDNEIIEIGAVKIDEMGNIEDEFEQFVKPKKNPTLSKFCKDLTSIKQSDIDNADEFPKVLNDFLNWAGKDVLFISWGFYDKNQFIKDCKRYKLNTEWIEEDGKHMNIKNEYSSKIQKKNKRFGLGKAIRKEGMEFEGTAHRGIDDARNITKIFLKYMDKLF